MLSVFKSYYRFYAPLLVLFSVGLVGTIGYVIIDDYSWFDAFYMTVITVATVGYGEVEPLSTEGKIFTSFLIITSFITFAYEDALFVSDGD